MIFNQPPDTNKRRIHQVLKYLERFNLKGKILDVGEASPMTGAIYRRFKVNIDNTWRDLDYPGCGYGYNNVKYDFILYLFTIEHQFNPLMTLCRLRHKLKDNGKILVAYPSNNCKLIWSKYHYHEIDRYRFKLLVEAAGLKIERFDCRMPCCRINGIRPILRYLFGYNAYYILTK